MREGSDAVETHPLASALRSAAQRFGPLPAVTVYTPSVRTEQSFAGLAQWAAKGAHLLQSLDLGAASDGDEAERRPVVAIDAPPSWITASIALATWWIGGAVTIDGRADVHIRDARRHTTGCIADREFVVGDAVDGGPGAHDVGDALVWSDDARACPDQPPPAVPPTTALCGDRVWRADDLLTLAASQGEGRAGVRDAVDPVHALVAVALRPLVSGRSTVVLDGVTDDVVAAERISTWIE